MLAKKRHITLLALLVTANCVMAAEDADFVGYIDLDLNVWEKTPKIDRWVVRRITIGDPSKRWFIPFNMLITPGITHTKREWVFGVKGQYTSTRFENNATITKEALNELWSNLQNAGILELKDKDAGNEETGWFGQIRIGANDQTFHFHCKDEPKPGDTWYKVQEVLFDLLKQRGLDVPGEPREISLFTKNLLDLRLSFLSESPVTLPERYINKKIETVTKTDDMITIEFDKADNIEPLKGKILHVYEDINDLPGRSISWLLTNSRSITCEGDDAEPREVTLAEIFKEPLTYHGKRVRVAGYFNPEFENMNFTDNLESGIWPRGHDVWIGGISTFCEEGTSRMAGAVTIDGTFIFGPGGHCGLWPGEITRPTRIVQTKEESN